MRRSLWSDSINISERKSLKGDIKTDVLVIGGGLCGLLCAYYLTQNGIDCVVAEGNKIASGVTQNTTAKITSQHGLIYADLIDKFGKETAQIYLDANQKAIYEYEKLCQNISCDFEKKPSYIYSLKSREKIENEVRALNSLGFGATFSQKTELPFKVKGAVCFDNQAQFNPLKFIEAISQNLTIYEDTFVRELTPTHAVSDKGNIFAKKIIVATHFPFINKHGSYFLKLYQDRSYVCAFENTPPINGMYLDENEKGLSFRNYNGSLLIGGSSHRTGKDTVAWKPIKNSAKRYYPDAKLQYEWATQDCMSLDKIPYIGQYSKSTPKLYVATGFNKWGMTSSMVSAMILTDLIQDKKNDFAHIFSPQRSMLKKQLMINGIEATANLLTPTTKRCPHLGCALKWNKAEHSWDCPCHGSRFEKDGSLINNPATRSKKM